MHGFKSANLAIFQFCQNSTFKPMHEIQIKKKRVTSLTSPGAILNVKWPITPNKSAGSVPLKTQTV